MKKGTQVTVISPLGKRFTANHGTFLRHKDGYRVVLLSSGIERHLPMNQGHRLTTKKIDISPCGLLE